MIMFVNGYFHSDTLKIKDLALAVYSLIHKLIHKLISTQAFRSRQKPTTQDSGAKTLLKTEIPQYKNHQAKD